VRDLNQEHSMEMKKVIVRVLNAINSSAKRCNTSSVLPRILDEKTLSSVSGGASSAKGAFGPGGLPKKFW
jgi:hypothetical protein